MTKKRKELEYDIFCDKHHNKVGTASAYGKSHIVSVGCDDKCTHPQAWEELHNIVYNTGWTYVEGKLKSFISQKLQETETKSYLKGKQDMLAKINEIQKTNLHIL